MSATSLTAGTTPAPRSNPRPFGASCLSGRLEGGVDHRPPLVLLHGLTFDSGMWQPALAALRGRDPGRAVLALDMPGHGDSPMQASCAVDDLAAAVASAAGDAGFEAPMVVGHSMMGIVATRYAFLYPSSGVINVDVALDSSFVRVLQSSRDAIEGPGFPAVWRGLLASMRIDLLPAGARELLSTETPRQDVVLAYWRQAFEMSEGDLEALFAQTADRIRQARIPYAIITGHDYDDTYNAWLRDSLPQATVTVYPDSGHFPHLADPERFAEFLAATGR